MFSFDGILMLMIGFALGMAVGGTSWARKMWGED